MSETTPNTTSPQTRSAIIDAIKAAAIIAVVMTHAKLPFGHHRLTLADQIWGGTWVNFHVPAFLAVSGFLYYSASPIAVGTVGRRLLRLLVPYFIASCIAPLLYSSPALTTQSFLPRLLSGGVVRIYYYVFLAATLIPTIWLLSRLPRRPLVALLAATFLYPALAWMLPSLQLPGTGYWGERNPLLYAPVFVAGWALREWLPEYRRVFEARATLWFLVACLAAALFIAVDASGTTYRYQILLWNRRVYIAAVGVLLTFLWHNSATESEDSSIGPVAACTTALIVVGATLGPPSWFEWDLTAIESFQINRTVYTASVVVIICWLVTRRGISRLPPAVSDGVRDTVRFLSDSSYTLYLYHLFFVLYLKPYSVHWQPSVRILGTALLSIAGASLITVVGRRLFRERSGWILGS